MLLFPYFLCICYLLEQTSDPVINKGDDEALLLQAGKTLESCGIGKCLFTLLTFYTTYKDNIYDHDTFRLIM